MRKAERYKAVIDWFQANMPVAESELHYSDPFQLVVAVILSAQCTDKRVNQTTPALFARYPDAKSMAAATAEEVYTYIRSVTYPNSKAAHLVSMARMLVEQFGSEVPQEVDQLQRLPGVGRKTANVVASVLFNKFVMPVDTHVFRVTARIGLTTASKTPLETEKQLTKHIDAHLLPLAHHWFILHGRYVCKARKPNCSQCGISPYCLYYETNN